MLIIDFLNKPVKFNDYNGLAGDYWVFLLPGDSTKF
jgi:hypothetical protein